MWEKYDVVATGNAPVGGHYAEAGRISGFGWTNGVFIDFIRRLGLAPAPDGRAAAPATPTAP